MNNQDQDLDDLFTLDTCPICLDDIQLCAYNYIKTNCKHCFHASCFMKHTQHNGYTCPCCRNELIEPANIDTVSDADDDSEADDETDILNERLHDLSLLALRYLFSRVENENENEIPDDYDIIVYQRGHEYNTPNLSISQISAMFQEQGLSYEDLVALCVLPHKDNTADVCNYNAAWMLRTEKNIRNMLHLRL